MATNYYNAGDREKLLSQGWTAHPTNRLYLKNPSGQDFRVRPASGTTPASRATHPEQRLGYNPTTGKVEDKINVSAAQLDALRRSGEEVPAYAAAATGSGIVNIPGRSIYETNSAEALKNAGYSATPGAANLTVGAPPAGSSGGSSAGAGPGSGGMSTPGGAPASEGSYEALKRRYLESAQESPQEKAAREQLEALTSQYDLGQADIENKPIAMQFITGQQAALERRNAALSTPLKYRLAAEQARRQSEMEAGRFLLEEERQREQDAFAREQALWERDHQGSEYGPGAIGEYQFAVQNGYKGSFTDYQNEDANRKARVAGAGGGGLSTAQMNSTINQIAGAFDNEPVVRNFNVVNEGSAFADSINPNTTNPADDIGMIYAFAKAMDPGSVVREGEYATVQKYAQSWAQQFGFDVKRIFSNSKFLSSSAIQNMQATIRQRAQVARQNYDNVKAQYDARIAAVRAGGFNSITDYGAFNTGSPQPTTQYDEADIREILAAHQSEYQTREALADAVASSTGWDPAMVRSLVYQVIPDKPASSPPLFRSGFLDQYQ